ncbi:MAG: GGDEF domain-containing protein [Lachnospiraceae bacterium]|nr:GGDEF domain-containing protein [Lachnospiraceae bacterium]
MDLDNFKLCNDTLGHQAGDEALCRVASILKENFRETDCVARVGGDEFMVYISGFSDRNFMMEKIERILKSFPVFIGEGENSIPIGVSIGLAFSQKEKELTYEEMYMNADAAMYRAKKAGKGRAVVFGEKEEQGQ